MKKVLYSIPLALIALLTFGCKAKTVYVPVREIQTEIEMLDRWHKDTVYVDSNTSVKDSIVQKDSIVYIVDYKGDIVGKEVYSWKERYRESHHLLSKLQTKYDSLLHVKQDSIRIDAPIPVDVPTPYYPTWMIVLAIIGGVGIGYVIFRVIRFIK